MELTDLHKLPRVGIDKSNENYHEIAEVVYFTSFKSAQQGMPSNRVVMYVEGLDYTGKMTGAYETLVGFLKLRFRKGLSGSVKMKKDFMFIPTDLIREYNPLEKKVEKLEKKGKGK